MHIETTKICQCGGHFIYTGKKESFHMFECPKCSKILNKMNLKNKILLNNNGKKENQKGKKGRMYASVKTWNPALGCRFDCVYCKPSFQKTIRCFAKMRGSDCHKCLSFMPHRHLERLDRIPSAETLFVCGNGDISFYKKEYMKLVMVRIKSDLEKHPNKQFYFQSKNPLCFEQYIDVFPYNNTILLTTLETNRDEGYDKISKAPIPSVRYQNFKDLSWRRKMVTIEPVLDFDQEIFFGWIKDINPEVVWIGYNSRPKKVQLPEPPIEKTLGFIQELRKNGFEVREKDMRNK